MSLIFLNKLRIMTRVVAAMLAVQLVAIPAFAQTVDVKERPLEWIKPGTVVENNTAKGWSHLIFLSRTRVAAGDAVGQTVKDIAKKFTVTVAANVVQEADGKFRFDKVGLGIGTTIKRKNTIISSATHEELRANLGFFEQRVLATSEKNFRTGNTQIARTPTMVVFDSKVMLRVQNENREMISRTVLLVRENEPKVGMLRWMFDESYSLVDEPMQYLKTGYEEDQVLYADEKHFLLGIPGKKGLAQVKMYDQKKPIKFTAALKPLAAKQRYSVSTAEQLESELWKLWGPTPAAKSAAGG